MGLAREGVGTLVDPEVRGVRRKLNYLVHRVTVLVRRTIKNNLEEHQGQEPLQNRTMDRNFVIGL